MTTTPRDPHPEEGVGTGASRVGELVSEGKAGWNWVQRLRPVRAYSHFTNVGGTVLAAGMSYQALFAVFAGLWVGFGVFGIVLRERPELLTTLVHQLDMLVPGLVGEHGAVQPSQLLKARTLDWTSLVAGASLLWVAITWFTSTRRAFRIIFGLEVKQYRNAVSLKLRDAALAISFSLAIVTSAALTVFSSTLMSAVASWLHWSPDSWLLGGVGTVARYVTMYVFDVLVLVGIHRFLAEVHVPRLYLWRGCLLGGAGLLAVKMLGTMLLGGASSNPLLATFAVLIGLLLWFNFLCRILLLTAAWIATGLDRTLGLPLK